MSLRALSWPDVERVARDMRAADRAEICATSHTDDPVEAVRLLQDVPAIGVTVWRDAPIAVSGAMPLWRGVWSMFMFATDRWPEVAGETSKFVRRRLLPKLRELGAHRLQCHSAADHHDAHRWIRWMGADQETPISEYGKNREDFVLFGMSRGQLERVTRAEN